jgi:exopolysaccharide biosynthesis polyprenyl glycosylphosphotransferase
MIVLILRRHVSSRVKAVGVGEFGGGRKHHNADNWAAMRSANAVTTHDVDVPEGAGRAVRGGSGALRSVEDLPPVNSGRSLLERRPRLIRLVVDAGGLSLASAAAVVSDRGNTLSVGTALSFVVVAVLLLNISQPGSILDRLRLEVLDDVRRIVSTTAVAAITAQFLTAFTSSEPSAYDSVWLWAFGAATLTATRSTSIALIRRRRRTREAGARTLIVGAGHVGHLTAKRLMEHPELGLHPIGFIDKEPMASTSAATSLPVLGASWDLESIVAAHGVECTVITFSSAPHDVLLHLVDECSRLGVRTLMIPRLFERVPSRVRLTHIGALPLIEMMPANPKSFQYALKYALDRVAALILIVLLAPILLTIAAAVLLSLGRPVFYRQTRVGLDGRPFQMLKFRTMLPPTAEDADEPAFDPQTAPGGVEGADRRTQVGAFLRRSSLDELAQLFNVLRGEMSLVGPRPERPEFVEYFEESVRRYGARHRVKSGITGWAQINRLRGQTSIGDRVEWDNYYIENFSLFLDLKILLRTIPEVFRGDAE